MKLRLFNAETGISLIKILILNGYTHIYGNVDELIDDLMNYHFVHKYRNKYQLIYIEVDEFKKTFTLWTKMVDSDEYKSLVRVEKINTILNT